MAHTKGPWIHRASVQGPFGFRHSVYAESETERVRVGVGGGRSDAECGANARLIAAAPDMYDALKAQEKAEEHFANCDHCCAAEPCTDYLELTGEAQRLRVAAIAKAEGQAL